ncbi:hypothetical protein DENSPDRAFT_832148 [Dentipellis sp. KUC8613]|nr:hypothetical protein DENSPDRAFT_832148 [Dentipellis sp. KUC8613]
MDLPTLVLVTVHLLGLPSQCPSPAAAYRIAPPSLQAPGLESSFFPASAIIAHAISGGGVVAKGSSGPLLEVWHSRYGALY